MANLADTSEIRDQYLLLDTNLFVLDPEVMLQFSPKSGRTRHNIVIPTIVIDELDNLKDEEDALGQRTERAKNSRQALSKLEELANQSKKSLKEGVPLNDAGDYQMITFNEYSQNHEDRLKKLGLSLRKSDNIILMIAQCMQEKHGKEFQLVTEDKGLFAKASSLGVNVQNWRGSRVVSGEGKDTKIYWGYRELTVPLDDYEDLEQKNLEPERIIKEGDALAPWEFLKLQAIEKGGLPLLAYFDPKQGKIVKIYKEPSAYLNPKNFHQIFALSALLNSDISLVHLLGRAGTGKTLLALAAGFSQLKGRGKCDPSYGCVMVMRPPEPAGRQLGYLPGSKEDKLAEWMQPIHDNFMVFKGKAQLDKSDLAEMKKEGLYVEDVHYAIRGRSLQNSYVIVDEAQNLTPREIKLIITRAGEGTKIVLTGDPYQIDHPALGRFNNGLVYSSEKMKFSGMSATVHLSKVERGALAEAASRLL